MLHMKHFFCQTLTTLLQLAGNQRSSVDWQKAGLPMMLMRVCSLLHFNQVTKINSAAFNDWFILPKFKIQVQIRKRACDQRLMSAKNTDQRCSAGLLWSLIQMCSG